MTDATSRIQRRPFVHVVIYGHPGHGKSTFLATFPRPMIVLQTDPHGKEAPYMRGGVNLTERDGDYGQLIYSLGTAKSPLREMTRIEIFGDESIKRPHAYRDFEHRFYEVVEEAADRQWATVIIDGITELEFSSRKQAEYVDMKKSADPRRWFAQSTHDVEEIIKQAGRLRCNVGIAAHVDHDYDEVKGHRVHNPAAPGKLRTRFGASFPEMYVMHAMAGNPLKDSPDKYWLQTRTDQSFAASSVMLNAPNPCQPSFKALWVNYQPPAAIQTSQSTDLRGLQQTGANGAKEGTHHG